MRNNENKDSPYGQVKEDYESGQSYQEAKFETSQGRKKQVNFLPMKSPRQKNRTYSFTAPELIWKKYSICHVL